MQKGFIRGSPCRCGTYINGRLGPARNFGKWTTCIKDAVSASTFIVDGASLRY